MVDWRRAMDAAGNQSNVANVAITRELACWCWAVEHMAESAQLKLRIEAGSFPDLPTRRALTLNSDLFSCSGHAAMHAQRQAIRKGQPQQRDAPALLCDGRKLNCQTGVEPDTRCPAERPEEIDKGQGRNSVFGPSLLLDNVLLILKWTPVFRIRASQKACSFYHVRSVRADIDSPGGGGNAYPHAH